MGPAGPWPLPGPPATQPCWRVSASSAPDGASRWHGRASCSASPGLLAEQAPVAAWCREQPLQHHSRSPDQLVEQALRGPPSHRTVLAPGGPACAGCHPAPSSKAGWEAVNTAVSCLRQLESTAAHSNWLCAMCLHACCGLLCVAALQACTQGWFGAAPCSRQTPLATMCGHSASLTAYYSLPLAALLVTQLSERQPRLLTSTWSMALSPLTRPLCCTST